MAQPPSSSPSAHPSGLILRSLTLTYLGVMVVLPLAALTIQAAEPGAKAFWGQVTRLRELATTRRPVIP